MSNFIPPKRKVVQIALSSKGNEVVQCIFALCDDGEIFWMPWDSLKDEDWLPLGLPPDCEQ